MMTSRAGEVAALLRLRRFAHDGQVADQWGSPSEFLILRDMVKAKATTEEHACASEDGGR